MPTITNWAVGSSDTGTTSVDITCTTGESVYVFVGGDATGGIGPSAVTDDQSPPNVYTRIDGSNIQQGTSTVCLFAYYCDNVQCPGGSLNVTVTMGALNFTGIVSAAALSGTVTPSLDAFALSTRMTGTGAVQAIGPCDLGITQGGELAFVFAVAGDSAAFLPGAQTLSPPLTGGTEVMDTDANGFYDLVVAYDPNPIPGRMAYNGTSNEGAANGVVQMMGVSIMGPPVVAGTTNTNPLSYYGYSPETMFGFRQEPTEG
jgi:hypothetical protein